LVPGPARQGVGVLHQDRNSAQRRERIDPTRHTIIYIGNPTAGVRSIHHNIVTALGPRPADSMAALTAQAYDVLAGEAAERGRTPVLVIDEAHLLEQDQLETIRMLTNHDLDSRSPGPPRVGWRLD
jgi:type II secretory pathway predicted ATPase ExeA